MNKEIAFNKFNPDTELEEQRALWKDAFPETIGTVLETNDFYRWKFLSGPKAHQYTARSPEGALLGYYAAIEFPYQSKSKSIKVGMVCDVMTSSRARGKGVFTKLGAHSLDEIRKEGIEMTTGYPIRTEVIPGHLKVGWKIQTKLPIYVKPFRINNIPPLRKVRFIAPLANACILTSQYLLGIANRIGNNYSTTEYPLQQVIEAEWYDQFIDKWISTVECGLAKKRDFIRWRLGSPGSCYRVFVIRDVSGEPVGLCFAKNSQLKGIPALALLDVMCLRDHKCVFRSLDAFISKVAANEGLSLIAGMINPRWAKTFGLLRCCYLRSGQNFQLITNTFSPEMGEIDKSAWPVMWIDSDDL